MEPSSSPSAGEDPNVCIRFWLGPTNLGILRPHLDVMKEHPVVIEQRDFRFDVYGRPADVANAIAFSFLLPTNNTDSSPQESTAATGTSPGYEQLSSSSLSPVAAQTGRHQLESDRSVTGCLGAQSTYNGDIESKTGYPTNKTNTPTPSSTTTTSPSEAAITTGPSADVVPQRTFTVNPADRKTDYDLALEHFFGKRNSKEQAVTEMQEPAPWSVVILLSMPFRVIQYLMLVSHGFRTYLVEEPNLEACGRQGISQERLKVIAQPAGLVVAVNNIQLPRLESNPEESPVWLQTDDRKALRAILLGVGKALAQEPVRRVILKGLGQEELALRKSWDGVLDQTYTSGATPNEREWVMDNRTSRQENLAPTEPVIWSEPSVDDRRLQYEKSLGTPTQRRPPPERARHSLRRVSSPPRVSENRQRREREARSTRLTTERDRWDTAAEAEGAWLVRDPWTTTTSQSVGSFFTESGLNEDSQGSGQSSRSTSSQEIHGTIAREPRRQDDNGDPWLVGAPLEESGSLEPATL